MVGWVERWICTKKGANKPGRRVWSLFYNGQKIAEFLNRRVM